MADLYATIGELHEAGVISRDEIDLAVAIVLARPDICAYPIRDGFLVNLSATIQAYGPAKVAVANPKTERRHRWSMVRTAILLARPEKA